MSKVIGNTVGTNMNPEKIAVAVPTKMSELENDAGYIADNYNKTFYINRHDAQGIELLTHQGFEGSVSKLSMKHGKVELSAQNNTVSIHGDSKYGGKVEVKDLVAPIEDKDAVNKKYVDDFNKELPKKVLDIVNAAGYIAVLKSPTATAIKLDDTVEEPFVDINAPNGSAVSVYGKNLLERKIRSDGEDDVYLVYTSDNGTQYFGYRTGSLSAGDYTVKFVCKDETVKPAYIYVNVDYADGTRLPNTLVMIYASTQDYTANPLKLTLEKSGQIFIYAAGATSYIQGARKEFGKMETLQIEAGAVATDYEDYKEPQIVTMPVDEMPTAYYPNTTVLCNEGCSVKYIADGTKAYNKLLDRIAALEAATVNNI